MTIIYAKFVAVYYTLIDALLCCCVRFFNNKYVYKKISVCEYFPHIKLFGEVMKFFMH